jgi:hypothetical protein
MALEHNKYYWELDRNGRILNMSDREIMNAKGYKKSPEVSKEQIDGLVNQSPKNEFTSILPLKDKTVDKRVDKIVKQLAGANIKELPDAYLHQKISFIKSGIRILGYIFLPFNLVFATILLILSEVIGIIEELV